MAKKGYIYKGLKAVYWCPEDRTALAEAGSHRELALEGAAAEQTFEGEPTGLELRLE